MLTRQRRKLDEMIVKYENKVESIYQSTDKEKIDILKEVIKDLKDLKNI